MFCLYSKFLFLVCGTTGKRKACKDCSCGLADELAEENGIITKAAPTQQSSCGSVCLHFYFVL